ncbi:MAG: sigma-70 family RNA polymerase sigma factor [Roseiarcus sp.]
MADDLHDNILQHLPHLRAFALLLTRERALADDLVQEAVVRALAHADQFEPGTNFKAWITTILRNCYFNEICHRGRLSQLSIGMPRDEPIASGGQEEHLDLRDFERAFRSLTGAQREGLLLVGASGFSYEEAAKVARCAVGTMKSRISRARVQLQQLLDGNSMRAVDGGARHERARAL